MSSVNGLRFLVGCPQWPRTTRHQSESLSFDVTARPLSRHISKHHLKKRHDRLLGMRDGLGHAGSLTTPIGSGYGLTSARFELVEETILADRNVKKAGDSTLPRLDYIRLCKKEQNQNHDKQSQPNHKPVPVVRGYHDVPSACTKP